MRQPQILVVEDEPIVAMDIEKTLKSLQYDVLPTVNSGSEAVKCAGEVRPDLVLMDIRLKGPMDGVDAAAEIHNRFGIPVVYLTAHADEATIQRAKEAQPFGYMLKPFEKEELHTVLEVALYKHRADRQLQERERWLDTVLRSTGDAIIVTDAQGIVMFMNPVAESLTRWKATQARGLPWREGFKIIDEQSVSLPGDVLDVFHGDRASVGFPANTFLALKDGARVPISGSAVAMRDEDGKLSGVVLAFQDVTQRRAFERELQKSNERLEERVWERTQELRRSNEGLTAEMDERRQVERRLRDSEMKFRSISDSASEAILVMDSGGKIIYANRSATALFGQPERRLVGTDFRTLIAESDRPLLDEIVQARAAGSPAPFVECRGLDAAGREFPVELSISTWWSEGKTYLAAILRDEGERKRLEAMLFRSEKLAAMGRMAAGIAHEFATPLAVIRGYAEMAMNKAGKQAEIKPLLEMIMKQVIRCGDMTQTLLTFSRKGKDPAKKLFDLKDAVLPALLLVESQARVKTVQIKKNLDDKPIEVAGHPDQIQQVVINLAENAFDAMPQGGTLTVETKRISTPSGPGVRLTFADTGSGVPPELQEKIFEPFFTTKSEKKGTGLGLWIVREIVTQHGGTVRCTARPNEGTAFLIELPLAPAQ
jgi:PAS domain S-box-containing protein